VTAKRRCDMACIPLWRLGSPNFSCLISSPFSERMPSTSTYSVAVSCLCHDNTDDVLPPLTAYHVMRVGKLPLLKYFRPGDRALARAVREAAGDHHAMLLANHGPIVSGKSLEEAVYAYEELEETAKLFFLLGDRKTAPLTLEAIAELNKAFPS
jgi:ribulose-5-phosphate 4-epimerase/fuculose-1-phosphate aldolase